MYEKFTDRARKIMQLANEEAQRFNHEYIGTEHILLGLIREGSGVAAAVLKNRDIDPRKLRLETEKLIQSGPDTVTMGKLPQTPRAKRVIEYAIEEAANFNHNYIGSEHILLGLLREKDGLAAWMLMNSELRLEDARTEVLTLLGRGVTGPSAGKWSDELRLMDEIEAKRFEQREVRLPKPPVPFNPPTVCPHCGRPYKGRLRVFFSKLLCKLLGRQS